MSSVILKGVGKRYIKYDDVPLLVTRALRFRAGNKRTHLWALRDIDVEVQPGESLGVIGRNGSGKSTMFRILAGVTAPTEGSVRVNGRIAPLISVGIGFHPELTGRENVYVNATILGLKKSEIDRRFDAIVAFAEIEEFIDTPVKFYSSGMFVRLGFSVAIAADPEILLVDEVLAVGDVAFQLKCFDRMEEIRRSGATVLVVSHSANAIRRLCTRTMLLSNGSTVFDGDTSEAIAMYFDRLGELDLGKAEAGPEIQITSVVALNLDGTIARSVKAGDEIIVRAEIHFSEPAEGPIIAFRVHRDTGQEVYSENTAAYRNRRPVAAGETIRCDIRMRANLPTAAYIVTVKVFASARAGAASAKGTPVNFFVAGRPFVKGVADLGGAVELTPIDPSPPVEGSEDRATGLTEFSG